MAKRHELNPSMFAACRCAIAVAYADGIFCNEERKIIDEYFKYLGFSDEQRRTIDIDIQRGEVDFDTEFAKITDHRARAYFINLARVLSYADGEFCVQEKAILDRVMGNHFNNMNFGTKKEPDPFTVDTPKDDCKLKRIGQEPETQFPVKQKKLPAPVPTRNTKYTATYKEVPLIQPNEILQQRKSSIKDFQRVTRDVKLSAEAQKLREFSMNNKERKNGFFAYLAKILE